MPDVMECSDGYVPPPRKGPNPFAKVDPNVLEKLPPGSRVVGATPHGSSFWTQTAKLTAHLADGTEQAYFLKVALGEHCMRMMNGEYESMTVLYAAVPDFVPKPYAWGSYKDIPNTHFFLCEFRLYLVRREAPQSAASPNGRYGFPFTTYMGPLPQDNRWCDTWEEYFAQGIRRMLSLERDVQGRSEELDELAAKLYDKVIPRLLRPLTTLRSIEPNCCTDVAAGKPIVFDACARTLPHTMVSFWQILIETYQKYFPISAPEEDHDDRNALYSIRFDIHSSCAYSSSKRFRRDFMTTMKTLVDKYPGGYEEWEKQNSNRIAQAANASQAYDDTDDPTA
ncbi:Fructosamine kinase-domain-containing protein [Corynascus novoguineensis]|uniref:protein-ribulosamine 3-kinase n=1 Tax=Corynascus novoguineensis TaxID=1126955 RepID=A0AAN7HNB0_9PEZI|nr:Fructosamine kinase-domain-containing protein [Corynascus novoguineensis]